MKRPGNLLKPLLPTSVATALAALLLTSVAMGSGWAADNDAAVKAGVSAAVRGDVKLANLKAPVAHKVGSGEGIFLGDHVTSGNEAGMQILLLDETVFTIGSQADMVIDNFVYDPASGAGKVTASVTKGAFRFVTGKVAANNSTDMEVDTPAATIGIRGTMVAGETNGTSSLIVLLGPGYDTDTSERIGRVFVSNHAGTVELYGAGYGTFVPGPDQPPGPPFKVKLDELIRLDLATGGSRGGGVGGSSGSGPSAGGVGGISGETVAQTVKTVGTVSTVTNIGNTTTTTIQTTVTPTSGCKPHLGAAC